MIPRGGSAGNGAAPMFYERVMTQDDALRAYARDPRNYRRHLQEPEEEVESEATQEVEKPVAKKTKK